MTGMYACMIARRKIFFLKGRRNNKNIKGTREFRNFSNIPRNISYVHKCTSIIEFKQAVYLKISSGIRTGIITV